MLGSTAEFVYGFVIVNPSVFLNLLGRIEGRPVVVMGSRRAGLLRRREEYVYAVKYGGFIFITRSPRRLVLGDANVIMAEKIVLPPAVWYNLARVR